MLKYSLNNTTTTTAASKSSDKMPARNFYIVESDANLTRQSNNNTCYGNRELDRTDPDYEEFTNYIHYRKPLKNEWHMPRPHSNASYNSHVSCSGSSGGGSSTNSNPRSSRNSGGRENIYEQVIDVVVNRTVIAGSSSIRREREEKLSLFITDVFGENCFFGRIGVNSFPF